MWGMASNQRTCRNRNWRCFCSFCTACGHLHCLSPPPQPIRRSFTGAFPHFLRVFLLSFIFLFLHFPRPVYVTECRLTDILFTDSIRWSIHLTNADLHNNEGEAAIQVCIGNHARVSLPNTNTNLCPNEVESTTQHVWNEHRMNILSALPPPHTSTPPL